jgi:TPP-dependent pyruvate/acetoin dehydrogenase alpha subunit
MSPQMSSSKAYELYRTMLRIRKFDTVVIKLYADGEIPGFMHLYVGEEAVAAGVCAVLRKTDYITSTHRGHGHCIAKGGRLDLMMAELFGKATGYCKGKGGSMHIADLGIGILGANGIVSGGIPIAVGAGVGIQYKNDDSVSVAFFGDGATNVGQFHEACNLAATWNLPVIFICENNQFAQTTPLTDHQSIKDVAHRALAYDMEFAIVDGNDVVEVHNKAFDAVTRAREGRGPTFIECKTYRWRGHWEGDPQPYRTNSDIEVWKRKCPIDRFGKYAIENKLLTSEELETIKKEVNAELEEAIEFARKSPYPASDEALEDVYTV